MNEFITENITSKILYHGSYSDDIKEFRLKSNNIGSIPPCIFFSSKRSVAKDYGNVIYKCKVKFENANEYDAYGESFHNYMSFEKYITDSYNDGYDCVIFRNLMDSKEPNTKVPLSDVYVLFDPKNIVILDII